MASSKPPGRYPKEGATDMPDESPEKITKPAPSDLKEGRTSERTRYVIIDPAGTLYSLKRELMHDVGFFEGEFLFRAGVTGARESFSHINPDTLPKDPKEALDAMCKLFEERGYGDFSVKEIDPDRMVARIVCPDTAEGWSFQHNNNLQREPVCSYARGLLSFMVGLALAGRRHDELDFVARETECIGAGAEECVFVIGPRLEIAKLFPDLVPAKDSFSEHELKLNEEILTKNLELQGLNLDLERQVRKRTEDFWRSEENYRALLAQSPDPIALITLAGKLTHVNPAGLGMFGFGSEQELADSNISSVLYDGENAWQKILWSIEKEGRAAGLEMALVDRTGRRLTGQVYARFADLVTGRCVEAVFRDVTEQKHMEEQIREARSESDFLNDLLSHDIINYTVSALHFLASIRKGGALDEESRKKLDVVTKDIQGAVGLAISVRDLARVKATDVETGDEIRDLQLLLSEAIEDSRMMYFDRETRFNFQKAPAPRYAKAGALVSRLFANLFTNAIKYDQHEVVTVDVTISDFVERDVQYWKTEIADRGVGIPDSDKERIFDRFKRGSTVVSGTGLGLFVASSIARASGGRIWAEDRIEGDSTKGAKMVVILPKADARQIAQLTTRRTLPQGNSPST